jgi:7-carboxy-7-deazaguanine synthase
LPKKASSHALSMGLLIKIADIDQGIERDGPNAGLSAVYIHMAGCQLECWYCESADERGDERAITSVVIEINNMRGRTQVGDKPICVLTGGDPMMQKIGPFVETLLGHGWKVQVETHGEEWTDLPDSEDLELICSPKSSKVHTFVKSRATAWRYMIREADDYERRDGLPVCNTQRIDGSREPVTKPTRGRPVWLQPVTEEGRTEKNTRAARSRAMEYGYRYAGPRIVERGRVTDRLLD